jgi:Flp pilus assembly protein TadD
MLIAVALAALVAAVYAGAGSCGFVMLDDSSHVYENPFVLEGLTWDSVLRVFTTPYASLWMPLTTLSFMVDVSFFGMNPSAMHLENVAWHAGATVVLFLALRQLTGRVWPSVIVAALFGVHPINVESVAWIAERKNVLCGFWSMVTLWCWAHYVRRKEWRGWIAVHASFALALLAKPMAVPLPAILLMLDFWPLCRWREVRWKHLLAEKAALFTMTFAVAGLALWASALRDSMVTLDELSWAQRLTNAFTACAIYLGQIVCPSEFAVLYHPPTVARWGLALGALALLLAITFGAWRVRKTHPWWLPCWLTFLGLLVPTLGVVQVGTHAHGDRFTYLAQIWIFIGIVWSLDALLPAALRLRAAVALCAIGWATIRTAGLVPVWTDSSALFKHSLAVTGPHPHILDLVAQTEAHEGNYEAAAGHWRDSLVLLPDNPLSWNSLGLALLHLRRDREAVSCFQRALACDPGYAVATFNLASTLDRHGNRAAAKIGYQRTLALDSSIPQAQYRLALVLKAEGNLSGASARLERALSLKPGDPVLLQELAHVELALR